MSGMKAILLSIRPNWCERIVNKEKTIEVRKTRPKLETPFKCYIYCTKAKPAWFRLSPAERLDGKVIGEFVCDEVYQYSTGNVEGQTISSEEMQKQSCLSYGELFNYENSAEAKDFCVYRIGLYGWHISDLKIYDKPRELSELGLIRPPQSWCYVKDTQ